MARTLPIRLRTITAAVVVIGSGLLIWNAYLSIIGQTDVTNSTLPVIKADTQPFRVKPDDPGGAEIPNQGNELFDVLNPENADDLALDGVAIDAKEEPVNLFDNPEPASGGFQLPDIPERTTESLFEKTPEVVDEVAPVLEEDVTEIEDQDREGLKEKLQAAIERAEDNTEILSSPPTGGDSKDQTPVQDGGDDNVVIPATKPIYTPPAQSAPTSITTQVEADDPTPQEFSLDQILGAEPEPVQKQYYIQLASLRSEAEARAAFGRIRDDFPSLVSGLDVFFPQADLGSRGVFTRIQIGPLNEAEARQRCADYTASARGGTCLVLSR